MTAPRVALARTEIDGVSVGTGHWIENSWRSSDSTIDVDSPIDGRLLGRVASGGAAEVDAAVVASQRAFPEWADLGPTRRREILRAVAARVADRADEFAAVESNGSGLLLRMLRRYIPANITRHLTYFSDLLCDRVDEEINTESAHSRVRYEPAGVAALIVPWNGPLSVSTSKLGAALAVGNTAIVKPPEWAPFSCALLAEVAAEAGLPAGVLNVVQGYGHTAGDALVSHAGVRRISFTGSPGIARQIAAAAAPNLVPLCLELGGKSPLVVFDDADLDAAARAIAAQYFHAGQICAAGTRVLVASSVSGQLRDRVQDEVSQLTVGDPRADGTDVGPLITLAHKDRVRRHVERAQAEGAEVLWGGATPEPGGCYFEPTMLAEVRPDMAVWQQEIFGPVLVWDTFDDDCDAIAKANNSAYGLAAHIWTESETRADTVARRLQVGTVWVNCSNLALDVAVPFGGTGWSGYGREGGRWSLEFFANIKTVSTRVGSSDSALLGAAG